MFEGISEISRKYKKSILKHQHELD